MRRQVLVLLMSDAGCMWPYLSYLIVRLQPLIPLRVRLAGYFPFALSDQNTNPTYFRSQ